MLTVFMMNVNSKYLAMSGSTNEVGGSILETSSRKTTSDSKMLMPSVTFSPASAGKQNTSTHRKDMRTVGSIKFTVQNNVFLRITMQNVMSVWVGISSYTFRYAGTYLLTYECEKQKEKFVHFVEEKSINILFNEDDFR